MDSLDLLQHLTWKLVDPLKGHLRRPLLSKILIAFVARK